MDFDLERFGRDLEQRLKWLLSEVRRLTSENARLLGENKQLREELTLVRLHAELDLEADTLESPVEEALPTEAVPPAAAALFQKLPNRLNFADFFRYAEEELISGEKAREFILLFFRKNMLKQRGRLIEKRGALRRAHSSLS